MCIAGSSEITKMICGMKEGEDNSKYVDYKINTHKTEWNGLLT
jgi:hypothetical protein